MTTWLRLIASRRPALALASLALIALHCDAVSAAILYESGTLGPTGIPYVDLTSQNVPGTNVNPSVYVGARFELTQPAITSRIGGHFVSSSPSTFFGAIIALDNASDFPNSSNLDSDDVLGSTELTFPSPSAETSGPLTLALDPGWYAVLFGSGLFNTTGNGVAVRNGIDLGAPQYISLQPTSAFGWVNLTTFPNHHFTVEGRIVPEPAAITLLVTASSFIAVVCRHVSC